MLIAWCETCGEVEADTGVVGRPCPRDKRPMTTISSEILVLKLLVESVEAVREVRDRLP